MRSIHQIHSELGLSNCAIYASKVYLLCLTGGQRCGVRQNPAFAQVGKPAREPIRNARSSMKESMHGAMSIIVECYASRSSLAMNLM